MSCHTRTASSRAWQRSQCVLAVISRLGTIIIVVIYEVSPIHLWEQVEHI